MPLGYAGLEIERKNKRPVRKMEDSFMLRTAPPPAAALPTALPAAAPVAARPRGGFLSAVERFGTMMARPGIQKGVGMAGAAISEPGSVGERLGQAAVVGAEASAYTTVMQKLSAGEKFADISETRALSPQQITQAMALQDKMEAGRFIREDEIIKRIKAIEGLDITPEQKAQLKQQTLSAIGVPEREVSVKERAADVGEFRAVTERLGTEMPEQALERTRVWAESRTEAAKIDAASRERVARERFREVYGEDAKSVALFEMAIQSANEAVRAIGVAEFPQIDPATGTLETFSDMRNRIWWNAYNRVVQAEIGEPGALQYQTPPSPGGAKVFPGF